MYDDKNPVGRCGMSGGYRRRSSSSGSIVVMSSIFRSRRLSLDNQELLDLVTGVALADAVPGGEGEGAAESPHDGDGGFGGVCERNELE